MSDALLAAFNDPNASEMAILDAIDTYAGELLSVADLARFQELPDNAGRQKAIALGLKEVADLLGDYATLEDIQAELAHQIAVEHAKFEFINAIDGAADAAAMAQALKDYVEVLSDQRQALIDAWEAKVEDNPDLTALAARVAALKAADYTTVLAEITAHIDDAAYMAGLAARLLEARGATQDGRFYGDVKIIAALDAATDDLILDTFNNDAATDLGLLAAIDTYAGELLSAADLARFQELPDNAGRQKAIALGLKEVADLLGDYTTLEALKAELSHQIDVEHDKFLFINAVDNAATSADMAKAIKDYVGMLNTERQALIAEWEAKAEGNPELAARVAELKADDYTTVLKEIATRLGQSDKFALDLAAIVLADRNDESTGGRFFGIGNIVAALEAASADIDYAPTAPDVRNVTTNEDIALVGIDIGAKDVDLDTLAYRIKDGEGPKNGVVSLKDGKFTYTPTANVHGADSFTIEISAGGKTIEQKVNVTINSVDDAPSAPALAPATVAENSAIGTVVGDLSATDIDSATLAYSLVDDAGGRFAVQGNKLVVKNGLLLDYEQAASHQVTVRVFDGTTNVDKVLTVSLTDVANETIKVSSGNNVLTGGIGKDKITGGKGKDIIGGGVGNDTLFGGKGKDIFVFDTKLNAKTNLDKISDFNVKDDSFWLDNAIFKKLGKGTEDKPGKLAKKYFSIDGAKDKNDYINYNSKTGAISYDADGLGGKKGIDFAKVKAGLKLTEKDFFIV